MRRYRSRRRNKQRRIIIVSICSLLLIMTAGYAAMQTNLSINAKGNVIENGMSAEAFIDSIPLVTEGDGLYADTYEEGRYIYRGSAPDNYVSFNGKVWRILSINTSNNTIKIVRSGILVEGQLYDGGSRFDNGYCNVPYGGGSTGCNIWESSSTLYNSNMSPISALDRYYYGYSNDTYALPTEEADLNIYLNITYYDSMIEKAQSRIINGIYKAGIPNYDSGVSLTQNIEQVSSVLWQGKVALLDVTEYIRTSTNTSCINIYQALQGNCSSNNWLQVYGL